MHVQSEKRVDTYLYIYFTRTNVRGITYIEIHEATQVCLKRSKFYLYPFAIWTGVYIKLRTLDKKIHSNFSVSAKSKKKNKMILIKYMNKKNNARTNDKFYSFFFTMTLWIFFILVQVKNFQRVISSPRIYVHVYVHL